MNMRSPKTSIIWTLGDLEQDARLPERTAAVAIVNSTCGSLGNRTGFPLTEAFFALIAHPDPALPSVGRAAPWPYFADRGVCGPQVRTQWREWLAGLRQIVETVNGKLIAQLGFADDRAKVLPDFQAHLAARMALHKSCIWLNQQLGRPNLAFVDLVDW